MALSLLQGYDSDHGSSPSDSEDDITVTINQEAVQNRNKRLPSYNSQQPALKKVKPAPQQQNVFNPTSKLSPRPAFSKQQSGISVPAAISGMFNETDSEVVHDDPTLHGGRIRSFGHEPNNWATYVYIDLQDCELDVVKDFIVKELKELDLEPIDHHHLSISRVVSFRHHWIDPFIQSIKSGLEHNRSFFLSLDKLQVYANDDRTRTFVGLEASAGTLLSHYDVVPLLL